MPSRHKRRRIGLLLPSSNTTQGAEFARILPDGVTLHVGRLPLRTVEASSTARVVEDLESESRKLSDADVDAIVLAATAPSSRNGIGYDQELIGRIELASGRKATTASTALIQALTALEVERLVLTARPGAKPPTRPLPGSLRRAGFVFWGRAHRGMSATWRLVCWRNGPPTTQVKRLIGRRLRR
jgi:maleate cis-trans isomerase